jgi:hypothetical protein
MGKPYEHPSNPCEIMVWMSPGSLEEWVTGVLGAGTRQSAKAADLH